MFRLLSEDQLLYLTWFLTYASPNFCILKYTLRWCWIFICFLYDRERFKMCLKCFIEQIYHFKVYIQWSRNFTEIQQKLFENQLFNLREYFQNRSKTIKNCHWSFHFRLSQPSAMCIWPIFTLETKFDDYLSIMLQKSTSTVCGVHAPLCMSNEVA